jgi:endonuclease III related protein
LLAGFETANTCTPVQVQKSKDSCGRHGWDGGGIVDLAGSARYLAKEMPAHVQPPPSFSASNPISREFPLGGAHASPKLRDYYDTLFAAFGPQYWWPGRTPFEIIVGAILTQNTSWSNVEPAIQNLRREKLLTPGAMEAVSFGRLAALIRSSGYFRQKARKLKAFVRFLRAEYQGSLAKMFRIPTNALREQLLGVHGIGPETADSILLYAGKHPVFVVDAYTRRILERHRLASPRESYEDLRLFFERSLPPDAPLYNEFHALIVQTGKDYCRARNPHCDQCPLLSFLPEGTPAAL